MKPSPHKGGGAHHSPKNAASPSSSREESQDRRNTSAQKNRGIQTPSGKSRPTTGFSHDKTPDKHVSEDLLSVEVVGGLLAEVSIASPSVLYRSSPNHHSPHTPSPMHRARPYTPRSGPVQHGDRGNSYRGSFDSPSMITPRPINTMVSAGGLTGSKVSIYVNASRCKLDTKRFSELLKFIVTQHILPYRDPVTQVQKKSLRILKFDVSSNLLDDAAVAKLVGFVRQHAAYLSIKTMKLYQNKIGDDGCEALAALITRDDGPTFQELHLSHNRITTRGAVALVDALAACPRYPFGKDQDKRLTPLWLRLEHNFLSAKAVLENLEKSNTKVCHVNAKGTACSPAVCQTPHAKLHLVFLNFQYWNDSLESAKQAMALIRAERTKNLLILEQRLSDSPSEESHTEEVAEEVASSATNEPSKKSKNAQILEKNDPFLGGGNDAPSEPSEGIKAQTSLGRKDATRPVSSVAGSSAQVKHNDIQAGPLYLFMDTNAVITAVLDPKHPWSFLNLKKRFCALESSDSSVSGRHKVVLVVTDTVLGELDGMHKKKVVKASVVNGLLMEAEKQGWLMMLGAHQGEKLVQALDGGALLGLDVTTSNDRMIVDIALMFAEELGDPHCAMFISEDHGARLTARNRGLCTVSMSQLQVILSKRNNDTWSSNNLKQWFLHAAPTKDNTDSPNRTIAQSPSTRSNPIAQLRSLKSSALKAMEIATTLHVQEEERNQLDELKTILALMANTLQNISVLPSHALTSSLKGTESHDHIPLTTPTIPLDSNSHEIQTLPLSNELNPHLLTDSSAPHDDTLENERSEGNRGDETMQTEESN